MLFKNISVSIIITLETNLIRGTNITDNRYISDSDRILFHKLRTSLSSNSPIIKFCVNVEGTLSYSAAYYSDGNNLFAYIAKSGDPYSLKIYASGQYIFL